MASIINASTSGAGGVITTADASGVLQLQTANTTAVTINASQNVGIGTASPASKLGVIGKITSSNVGSADVGLNIGIDSVVGCSVGFNNTGSTNVYGAPTSSLYIATAQSFPIIFSVAGEKMRIDSSGNVLVGTTSPNSLTSIGVTVDPAGAVGYTTSNTGTQFPCAFRRGGNIVGTISTTTTATAYNTSSDYRLKEDVAPMVGALDTVAQLKPVTYKWKSDGSEGQGFIAHELAEVVPDCVSGEKDAVDADGNPVYQGIDTSFLVATLTAAIQEQQAIINDLKARIETLEGASA